MSTSALAPTSIGSVGEGVPANAVEITWEPGAAEIFRAIVAERDANGIDRTRPYMVAIVGIPGSGKVRRARERGASQDVVLVALTKKKAPLLTLSKPYRARREKSWETC